MEDPPNRFLQKQVAAFDDLGSPGKSLPDVIDSCSVFLECDVVLNFLHITVVS